MRLISIGEVLWDVIGEAEYLGGAPLNFAAHARKLGHEVFLISAVGDDERGRRALERLKQLGVSTEFVQVLPGRPLARRWLSSTPTASRCSKSCGLRPTTMCCSRPKCKAALPSSNRAGFIWERCITWGERRFPRLKLLLEKLPDTRRLYDVNLRDGQWNLGAVEELAKLANLIKLSGEEAEFLDGSLKPMGMKVRCGTFASAGAVSIAAKPFARDRW